MTSHLLFVCAANVCRSPLMAYSFAEALQRSSAREEWVLMSRGVSAPRSLPICDVVASLIARAPDGATFAETHTSSAVGEEDLAMQDLIITASREERSRLARISPESRNRTFTLREAVALGGQSSMHPSSDEPLTLAGFAAVLNSRRGRVSLDRPQRNGLPWAAQTHPLDVPDIHSDRPKRHLSTLNELVTTIETFHGQVAEYIAPR